MAEFVARQPIFNREEKVHGYELLFRSAIGDSDNTRDEDAASRNIADHLLTLGKSLTNSHPAFIQCSTQFLLKDYITLLPPEKTVVEILDAVPPEETVLAACRRLRQSGYTIAFDDFVFTGNFKPFVELASIVKVDFTQTPVPARKSLVERFPEIELLAEKVESRQDFDQAVDDGYRYFQGGFFCQPNLIVGRRIPAFKLNYLRILEAVSRPDFNLAEVEGIVSREVSLCYKLLHYVNSALFGFRSEIRSLRHALTLLGQHEVRRLVSMVAAVTVADDTPSELILTSLARARCCELVASRMENAIPGSSPFLVGMFSLMDAVLGRPMKEILEEIALPEEVKAALLGNKNRLREIFELVFAYEAGNWGAVNWYATKVSLDETLMPIIYFDSLDWARVVFDISAQS